MKETKGADALAEQNTPGTQGTQGTQGTLGSPQPPEHSVELSAAGRPIATNWKQTIAFIWSGQTFSIITSYAAGYAAIWFITSTFGSPLMLALASIVALLPTGILSPFGGVLADRFNRRSIMLIADSAVGFSSLVLALIILFWQGTEQQLLPIILVVIFVRAVGQAFHTPAMTAAMPLLVPERHLVRINSLSQMVWSAAGIGAPALGILLYTTIGFHAAMFLDALGAVIACLGLLFVKIPTIRDESMEGQHIFRNMADGMHVIFRNRGLFILVVFIAVAMILFMPIGSLFPLMTNNHFGVAFGYDKDTLGYMASLVEAVFGGVMLVGTLVLIAWGGGKRHTLVVLNSGLGVGISILLCGLLAPDQFWLFVVLSGVMSAFCSFYNAPLMTIIQRHSPEEKLGRVMGLFGSIISLAAPIGLILGGVIAEYTGIATWFLISGILMVALSIPVYFIRPVRALDNPTE
ncbi:MAG: MFS transporter [Coriobacteriales bacterium]|nr:MFS transporter [Coriobacteriales bacterium]